MEKVTQMEIFHYRDVEAKEAEEGASGLSVRWLITKEMGAKNFAMRMFEMESEGCSPFHSHPWEHEVFILEGEGLAIGEREQTKVTAGDVIFIPPDEKHQLRNRGKKILKFICLVPYTHEYLRAHT